MAGVRMHVRPVFAEVTVNVDSATTARVARPVRGARAAAAGTGGYTAVVGAGSLNAPPSASTCHQRTAPDTRDLGRSTGSRPRNRRRARGPLGDCRPRRTGRARGRESGRISPPAGRRTRVARRGESDFASVVGDAPNEVDVARAARQRVALSGRRAVRLDRVRPRERVRVPEVRVEHVLREGTRRRRRSNGDVGVAPDEARRRGLRHDGCRGGRGSRRRLRLLLRRGTLGTHDPPGRGRRGRGRGRGHGYGSTGRGWQLRPAARQSEEDRGHHDQPSSGHQPRASSLWAFPPSHRSEPMRRQMTQAVRDALWNLDSVDHAAPASLPGVSRWRAAPGHAIR